MLECFFFLRLVNGILEGRSLGPGENVGGGFDFVFLKVTASKAPHAQRVGGIYGWTLFVLQERCQYVFFLSTTGQWYS